MPRADDARSKIGVERPAEVHAPVDSAEKAHVAPDAGPLSHRVFHHLAAPKAAAYRAILQVFVAAKERFEIALRAPEVAARLVAPRARSPNPCI